MVLSTIVNKIQTLEDIGLSLTDFSITPSEGVAFSSEFTIVFDLTGATKEYERYGLTIKPADSASWELNNYLTN